MLIILTLYLVLVWLIFSKLKLVRLRVGCPAAWRCSRRTPGHRPVHVDPGMGEFVCRISLTPTSIADAVLRPDDFRPLMLPCYSDLR
jgi:hypothetical protein